MQLADLNSEFFSSQKDIKANHINILMFLYNWVFSDKCPEMKIINDRNYFHIDYGYLSKKLNIKYRTLQNNIKRLNDLGFIKTHIKRAEGCFNTRVYMNFNYDLAEQALAKTKYNKKLINNLMKLRGSKDMLLDESDVYAINKKKYTNEAEKLVCKLLQKYQHIFTTRVPNDLNNPTKTFSESCLKVQDIYNGVMSSSRYYPLSDDFEDKSSKYFNISDWRNTLKSVKGDWSKVESLIDNAVSNFSLMFNDEYMPYNKDYLTNNFNNWLFDKFNGTSQFIQSLRTPEKTSKHNSELKADKIFETLPKEVKKAGNLLYELNQTMPAGLFWENISKMYQWAKTVYATKDVTFWVHTPDEVIKKFYDYCVENKLYISVATVDIQKAVDCSGPWVWFIKDVSIQYDFDSHLCECVTDDEIIKCLTPVQKTVMVDEYGFTIF